LLRKERTWAEKIFVRDAVCAGKRIHVVGC
jgi:hypothetical protein